METFKIWDVIAIIKDINPLFKVSINGVYDNIYSYEEIATNNILNQYEITKLKTQLTDNKTMYIIDCEG